MANHGIYREPGTAGGLPLPRTRLMGLTIVVALLAFLAVVTPQMLLAVVGHSAAGAWRLFKEGGLSMYVLLLLDLAMPIAIAVLGAFVLRGKRAPAGLLFAAATLPFGVALLGAWSGQRMTMGAISGESVDLEMKARILAEGISESMATDIFGGFVVCGAALVAAVAAASALATIDVATITRNGPKPSSLGVIGAAVAGGVWILATLVIGGARLRAAGGLALLPVLPVIVLVVFAVLAGRGASVLRAWHDPKEASRGAAALVVAMVSALLAVLALQRGIESSFTAKAFAAIAGESVDPSQRARILGAALDAGHLSSVTFAIHAVLGSLTFLLALLPALGNGRNPLTASSAIAVLLGVVLLGGTFALAHARTTAPRTSLAHAAAPGGVTLPVVVETFSDKSRGSSGGRDRLVVDATGKGEGDLSTSTCSRAVGATVYADARATIGMVAARLPKPEGCGMQSSMSLVMTATRTHPPEIDARLGDYALYLGSGANFPFTFGGTMPGREMMRVRSVEGGDIEINGVRLTLPLAKPEVPSGGSQAERVEYTFRPSDTVDHVISTVVAVETQYADRIVSYSLDRQLIVDDGTRAAAVELGGGGRGEGIGLGSLGNLPKTGLRAGSPTVNGRLPPEVIQRIVRQSFGRLRLCYENGLRKNPALAGRVTVKFVIDRTGSVSTASDGGSDLADTGVIACVVRSFGNLSFPQPEASIVTVVYPIDFTPTPK